MTETAEKPKPSSPSDLRRQRERTVQGPSGATFTIRPINLTRHALSGGLPDDLISIALNQLNGKDPFESIDATDPEAKERLNEYGRYRDNLVRAVIVTPSMAKPDDESKADPLEDMHPVDYNWALGIATGETIVDGNGDLLWGTEETIARFRAARERAESPNTDSEGGS